MDGVEDESLSKKEVEAAANVLAFYLTLGK
jgi:hypothetical protein